MKISPTGIKSHSNKGSFLSAIGDDLLAAVKTSIQTPGFRPESTVLFVIVILYALLGLMMSTSPALFSKSAEISSDVGGNFATIIKQASLMSVGLLFFLLFSFVNLSNLLKPAVFWLMTAAVAFFQLLPPMIGQTKNGASRWVFGVQASDILSIYLIFYAAYICSDGHRRQACETIPGAFKYILLPLGGVIFLIAKWQQNLSTALLLVASTIIILMLGKIKINKHLLIVAAIVGAILAGVLCYTEGYRLNRINNWLKYDLISMSPVIKAESKDKTEYTVRDWDDTFRDYATGEGSQAFYSKLSIMSGGPFMSGSLIGFGPGGGKVHAAGRLAISESDYVFSAMCAEWGFVGITALLLFTSYCLLNAMHFRSGEKASLIGDGGHNKDPFLHLLAMGVVVMISMQGLVHIFVNLSLFPVTGVPLPLFSNGGTSRVIVLCMLGILLNVSCDSEASFPKVISEHKKMISIAILSLMALLLLFVVYKAFMFFKLPF